MLHVWWDVHRLHLVWRLSDFSSVSLYVFLIQEKMHRVPLTDFFLYKVNIVNSLQQCNATFHNIKTHREMETDVHYYYYWCIFKMKNKFLLTIKHDDYQCVVHDDWNEMCLTWFILKEVFKWLSLCFSCVPWW